MITVIPGKAQAVDDFFVAVYQGLI